MPKGKSLHDRLTRRLLSDVRVARGFCKLFLPPDLLAELDLSTLQLFKENFVGKNLKAHSLDLVYTIKVKDSDEIVYVIVEHTSTSQPLLPLRMQDYARVVTEQHMKDPKNKHYPYVYSIILYSGDAPYTHSLNVFDRFPAHRQEDARKLAMNAIPLVDAVRMSDDVWKKDVWFGPLGLSLKHIKKFVPRAAEDLWKMLEKIEEVGEVEYAETITQYIMLAGEAKDQEQFFRAMEKLNEEDAMTIAQYLEQRGMEKGIQQGLERGIDRGREEREKEIAKALLSKGIEIGTVATVTGQPLKELKKLFS